MKMKNTSNVSFFDKKLQLIVGILFLIILVVPGFYYFNFSVLTNSQETWGQFGDFIGGVLNPIIAIANLGFLVYLTLLVKHRDDAADERAIQTQTFISLNQFRNEAYLELIKRIKEADEIPTDSFGDLSAVYLDFYDYLIHFERDFGYLFETNDYESHFNSFKNNVHRIFFIASENAHVEGQPVILMFDSQFDHYRVANNEYLESQYTLIRVIQHIIINKPFTLSNFK